MRANEVAKILGGAIIVYVVMAACGSAGSGSGPFGDGDASVLGDSSGGKLGDASNGISDSAGGVFDALIDAITNPVPDAKADVNQSGTRLKAKYYAGSDGSKVFIGMYDSQRNEDCSFTLAGDGVLRCLPTTGTASVSAYYSDSACSVPLALINKGCTSKYIVRGESSTGACVYTYKTHLHQYGAPYTAPTAYVGSSGSCSAAVISNTMFDFFSVGPEIPPSSFVDASIQTEP